MIWFPILIALIVVIMLVSRRRVQNCPGCKWGLDDSAYGHFCTHPDATGAPELAQIQAGMWRCPWREAVGSHGGFWVNPRPQGPRPERPRTRQPVQLTMQVDKLARAVRRAEAEGQVFEVDMYAHELLQTVKDFLIYMDTFKC